MSSDPRAVPAAGWHRVRVQQQALRDLDQAWRSFSAGTHRQPGWRRRGRHEGFRIVGGQAGRVEQLNRKWSRVLVPKAGWVRFRRARAVPGAKSYRSAGIPEPIPGPGTGEAIGIDRGAAVSLARPDGGECARPRHRARAQSFRRPVSLTCAGRAGPWPVTATLGPRQAASPAARTSPAGLT
jgi:hypothetical protein